MNNLTNWEIESIIGYLEHTKKKLSKYNKVLNQKRVEELGELIYKLEQMKEEE